MVWFTTKDIVTISGTILRTLQKDPLCTLGIASISKKNVRYDRVQYSISTLFVHYRSFNSMSGNILYCNIGIRDKRISKAKSLISYMISVQCRDIRISKFSFRYQRFCRYQVKYAIPRAAGHNRASHVPAPPTGPASWSWTRLDGLYSCVTVLTPFSAGFQLLPVAAVARPWLAWYELPSGHGGQSWFQVIVIQVIWWWSTWCHELCFKLVIGILLRLC